LFVQLKVSSPRAQPFVKVGGGARALWSRRLCLLLHRVRVTVRFSMQVAIVVTLLSVVIAPHPSSRLPANAKYCTKPEMIVCHILCAYY